MNACKLSEQKANHYGNFEKFSLIRELTIYLEARNS